MHYIIALIVSGTVYSALIALFRYTFELQIPISVQLAVVVANTVAIAFFETVQNFRKDKK